MVGSSLTIDKIRYKVSKKASAKVAIVMNFVLCDDNPTFLKELHYAIQQHCAIRDWACDCMCYNHPKDLLSADLSGCHVLFLDIDMPGVNGLDAAKLLRQKYPDLFIVFVTAYIEYAPAGYHVDAFRYLLKPNLSVELPACLDAIWEKLFVSQDSIQVQRLDQLVCVRLKDILYIEGTAYRHVLLHTIHSSTPWECIGKLSNFDAQLAEKGFLRIQKSFLVNMWHTVDIRNYYAHLDNGEALKVSQQNYSTICRQYVIWKGQSL